MKHEFMKKVAKAIVLPLAIVGAAGVTGCSRITDRETGLRTTAGQAGDEFKRGEGWVFYVPGIQSIHEYPLWMQTLTVQANEANLRTSDNQQIIGALSFQYEIKDKAGTATTLFKTFNDNYEKILKQRAQDSAVKVFGKKSAIDLTSNIQSLTDDIRNHLQSALDAEDIPFAIVAVTSAGIGLSNESNQKLEALMLEQQRARVLDMRKTNAIRGQEVATAEAKVTANALAALRQAGVPENQILQAYCLQLSEKEGHVNAPFSPGCFGGEKAPVAVSVPAKVPAPKL